MLSGAGAAVLKILLTALSQYLEASVPSFEARTVHFVVIAETKLQEKTYHRPTKLSRVFCASRTLQRGSGRPSGGWDARVGNRRRPHQGTERCTGRCGYRHSGVGGPGGEGQGILQGAPLSHRLAGRRRSCEPRRHLWGSALVLQCRTQKMLGVSEL